jgi:hypothetical protein
LREERSGWIWTNGRATVTSVRVVAEGGRSRPAVRPPVGEALRARSVPLRIMVVKPREGLVVAFAACVRVDALRCRLQFPAGCGGQAGRARLLGHVFAEPQPRVMTMAGTEHGAIRRSQQCPITL